MHFGCSPVDSESFIMGLLEIIGPALIVFLWKGKGSVGMTTSEILKSYEDYDDTDNDSYRNLKKHHENPGLDFGYYRK